MLDTVATRSPAMTAGTAIGNWTWKYRRTGPKPMAVAAASVSCGTERTPSTIAGTSTTRL